jgi:glucosamine-6-phosphate deaminase
MIPVICADYEIMSLRAAEMVVKGIPSDRESLISFPAGDTPLGMIDAFVELVNNGKADLSRTRYVSLDEWVGLGREDRGSCAWFNHTHLLDKLHKPFLNAYILNGKAQDIDEECRALDAFIEQYGPLDISVVGIGLNGHLGFNEDGDDFTLNAHVISLSQTTRSVMHKYFDRDYQLEYGITQGLKQIMAAHSVILIVNGPHKAEILHKAFYGPVDNTVPASILQWHPNCFVIADKQAAAGL